MRQADNCSVRLLACGEKQFYQHNGSRLIIALGSNEPGKFGSSVETMCKAVGSLAERGISVVRISSLYRTRPVGGGRQGDYLNAVALAVTRCSLPNTLRTIKQIEKAAGRRLRGLDRPRPLDIDIIAAGGRIVGWQRTKSGATGHRRAQQALSLAGQHRPKGWLTVPHPLMHGRRFVLVPLAEIAPDWHHPVLGVTATRLLARLPPRQGDVERVVDSGWILCHKDT